MSLQILEERVPLIEGKLEQVQEVFPSFLDAIAVASGRATAYNSKAEQEAAMLTIHNKMFSVDRSVYGLTALLPSMDRAKQMAVITLLSNPFESATQQLLTPEFEFSLLKALIASLPTQRVLKLFEEIQSNKINNTRTRKLISEWILTHPNLEYNSVKYRRKLRNSLTHVFGTRRASIIKSILGKGVRPSIGDITERNIIFSLLKTLDPTVLECVSFIFGNENDLSLSKFKQYNEAKASGQLSRAEGLPLTTIMGIWRHYHRSEGVPIQEVYDLAKMTETEKMTGQTAAKKAGKTDVTFDPLKQDLNKLMIYAYEKGLTPEITEALKEKARRAYQGFPLEYDRVAFILDASESMRGHHTQALRPIAISVAAQMTLQNAPHCTVHTVGGAQVDGLTYPKGGTDLASALLDAVEADPQVIYIATDGYENEIAGRLDETVRALNGMGISIPIIQLTPVIGAEAMGTRTLSKDIPVLPVSNMNSVGTSMLKTAFMADPKQGLNMLLNITTHKLVTWGAE